MLTPSPPPTPEDIIEEVPATIEESSIRPDEVSTFTNPGRPVPQPYGFYGAPFDMEPSTELTHVRARAEIFGDAASPSSGDRSGTQESQDARHWTSDVAALQSRTERLQERVKHGLKKVQDSIGQKARKVRVAEQIVFQRMGSVTRRGVERKNSTVHEDAEGRCKGYQDSCCSLDRPSHEGGYARASIFRSSIRAHMVAFSFSTMIPMETIHRFKPTQRTAIMASNLIMATQDMMKLSQIWSRLFSPSPPVECLISLNPLLILSDDEAEKLCRLMEHGLHCWAYWSLLTELSVNEGVSVDDAWLSALGAELDDLGRLDTEDISQHLVRFGSDNINAPHLQSVMGKTKCLDVGMSIRRSSTRGVPSTSHNDEVFELDAVETEAKSAVPTAVASVASSPDTESEPLTPTKEDSQRQLTAMRTANEEDLVFEDESAIADRGSSLEAPVPSSPGILEELNAALDGALDERVDVFYEPVEDEPPSQVLPLTTKTNQERKGEVANGSKPVDSSLP
ncbi:hypothetical protein N0V91_005151 [Didymella pomorum]|uniref:Uncharacterized protein n=1 Tax=Didymella pomorum TaxID=749634 RepID=A0A9W9D704_9PLEO|nr:hypothetical protein N0V91_005151 [Didymella pomorum]